MCCGKTLIHIIKFCFVLLLLASGIALIGVGSVVTSDENDYIDLIGSKMIQVAIYEICLGIIVVLFSVVGCVWAWKENKMLLWLYISMLFMITIMEFSGGIAAFVYKDDVSNLATSLIVTFTPALPSDAWNTMQKSLECCGVFGPYDYLSQTLPTSCCSDGTECNLGSTVAYTTPCYNATVTALEDDANLLGGMGIGLGFLQLACLLFTCADVLLIKFIKCICPCCCK